MNQKIYPATLADMLKEKAGDLYRPSNGTEGEYFFDAWCRKCQRDKAMREGCDLDDCDDNERCDLIAASMAFDIDEDGYPKEWRYGKDGQPCCTAFVPAGDPIPPPRDDLTFDMFEGKD